MSGSRGSRLGGPRRELGYNLVVLAMTVTVLSILVAAAIPVWSQLVQRQREEELVFRGLQYAEAIRVFQARFGRPPTRLQELIETTPRCIRQLYPDPMTEDGEWGVLFGQQQQRGRGRGGQAGRAGQRGRQAGGAQPNQALNQAFGGSQPRQQAGGDSLFGQQGSGPAQPLQDSDFNRRPGAGAFGTNNRDTGLTGERRQSGPIIGVHSLSDDESIRIFFGAEVYNEWAFTVDKLPVPAVNPSNGQIPRASARWVGRPFPEGVQPQSGSGPGLDDPGDTEDQNPFSQRRNPLDRGNGGFGNRDRGNSGGNSGFGNRNRGNNGGNSGFGNRDRDRGREE